MESSTVGKVLSIVAIVSQKRFGMQDHFYLQWNGYYYRPFWPWVYKKCLPIDLHISFIVNIANTARLLSSIVNHTTDPSYYTVRLEVFIQTIFTAQLGTNTIDSRNISSAA